MELCKVPPEGWRCQREAGHPGPCAAVPIATSVPMPSDKILKHFETGHLPAHLQEVSLPFCNMAHYLTHTLVPGPERSVALRKLLEAKDAAVRARVHPGG